VWTLDLPEDHARALALAPDGGRAAVSTERALVLFDARTGREQLRLPRRQGSAYPTLAFTPDGSRLASAHPGDGGAPGELKIWETASGQELLTLRVPGRSVSGPAFSPDGRRLSATLIHPGPAGFVDWDIDPPSEEVQRRRDAALLVRLAFER